jgi:glycine/D-amino acid oxidase-like deaminating enzyme
VLVAESDEELAGFRARVEDLRLKGFTHEELVDRDDEIPVVGPSTTSEGVFHQFGFSGHGFQLGPATGAVMAELVATGKTNTPIDGLGIDRFLTDRARPAPS